MASRLRSEIAPPTAADVRRLLSYDPTTGLFTRLVATGGRYRAEVGTVAGTLNDQGYVLVSVMSKQYRAHRLAWLYVTGEWPKNEIDHRNLVRSDNRWANLRDVAARVNAQNKVQAQRNSKTGLRGASYSKRDGVFVARIKVANKYLNLGAFATAEQAHQAYVAAKRQFHAGCTI